MTRAEALAQAEGLNLRGHTRYLPHGIGHLMHRVVADPRASSDTLLIVADALREYADFALFDEARATLRAIADAVAALAPSRA